jgi:hypothetical protein
MREGLESSRANEPKYPATRYQWFLDCQNGAGSRSTYCSADYYRERVLIRRLFCDSIGQLIYIFPFRLFTGVLLGFPFYLPLCHASISSTWPD